ncbi:MAG: uroporphyrinogen-III synthase [Nitrososphaerales archaeon]
MKAKIVLTNPRRHEELKKFIESLGLECLIYPLVEINPKVDRDSLQILLKSLKAREIRYMLFLTGQAVKDFLAYSQEFLTLEELKELLNYTEIWARGLKAKRNLEKEGLKPKLFAQTFKELSYLFKEYELKDSLIGVVNYGIVDDEVYKFLESKGAKILSTTLYSSSIPKDEGKVLELFNLILKREVNAITFMSALSVDNFFELARKYSLIDKIKEVMGKEVLVGSVGPVSSEALEYHGIKDYIMPEIYTAPILLKALADKIRKR